MTAASVLSSQVFKAHMSGSDSGSGAAEIQQGVEALRVASGKAG